MPEQVRHRVLRRQLRSRLGQRAAPGQAGSVCIKTGQPSWTCTGFRVRNCPRKPPVDAIKEGGRALHVPTCTLAWPSPGSFHECKHHSTRAQGWCGAAARAAGSPRRGLSRVKDVERLLIMLLGAIGKVVGQPHLGATCGGEGRGSHAATVKERPGCEKGATCAVRATGQGLHTTAAASRTAGSACELAQMRCLSCPLACCHEGLGHLEQLVSEELGQPGGLPGLQAACRKELDR